MKYYEFKFIFKPKNEIVSDILMSVLGDVGFESFVEEDDVLKAYIQQSLFNKEELQTSINQFPIEVDAIDYTYTEAEDKDWNEEWEKNFFKPIIIDDLCAIHSTFHTDIPKVKYDIIINPQMAFGTGHHETTSLILNELLQMDLQNKAVLDMGCGTSILAILASKRGAKPITAIDIDSWCVDNSKANCQLNQITDIDIKLGDASILKDEKPFNLVIANINRNILLQDMDKYVQVLQEKGKLLMSGFYTEDIAILQEKAESLGLHFVKTNHKNNWACLLVQK
ncbi:Ribosomal protein L11 methyltransferase [Bacteroides coprosuis DSM 18011]|uniref:Ribosomal protein L11 methyltransferase n=1 Tax=Bacteroides coprosuis DSM 18011 TaxID=679937 RepID=F3ZTX4_9BACE|nr:MULTISPECIES: 50S ribosomal protein L11 methyltransferase [Bacteroides]EGJ72358.1 Ribosomal protein L11 methyltransferase [Bacteroides coprosuis DSM 18011]